MLQGPLGNPNEQHLPPMSQKALKRLKRRQQKSSSKVRYQPSIIRPLNARQSDLIDSLKNATQIFAIGEAGTGKTWLSCKIAIQKLKSQEISKILIARPTTAPKRHQQGFLPGKLEQKLAPWLVPMMDAFKDEVSAAELERLMGAGDIEFLSFEHMRGRTFKDAFVILDEAQNCTFADLRLFLTRKGEDTTYVVTGDPVQSDIDDSGLVAILDIIEKYDIDADIIEFLPEDVVRSEHAREWVEAFSKWTANDNL